MKQLYLLTKIFVAFIALFFASYILGAASGLPILAICIVLFAASFIPMPSGVLGFNLITQIFADEITKGLFPDNAFYKRSKDDSAWVNSGQVNLPQKGAAPNVATDRSSFPGTVTNRTDTASGYLLHEFSTDPIQLQYSEELIVSYDKRASILYDIIANLETAIADYTGVQWGPTATVSATNYVLTTGAARPAGNAGATGTRKALTKADLVQVKQFMDKMNIPQEDRYCVMTADQYADMLNISDFTDAQKFGTPGLPDGVITKLLNFNVFVRSRALTYDNSGTPVKKAYGAATATTDCGASLFWHPMFVRRAEGSVQIFDRINDPLFYGDVFSAAVRFGAAQARADQAGVIALIETFVS